MFLKRSVILFSLALFTMSGFGCDRKEEASAPAGPVWKPAGNEGNVTGVINFTGAVPAPSKLDMSNDSNCAGENFLDDVVVNNVLGAACTTTDGANLVPCTTTGAAQLTSYNLRGRRGLRTTDPLGFTSAFDPRQLQFGVRFNF